MAVGCMLAHFSRYIKMRAEYLKCDLALKQWGICEFFMGSSRKYFIVLILKEEKGEIKRFFSFWFPPLGCSCVSMVVVISG